MGTYLSAGVYSIEKDISEIVPNIATTTAALCGHSVKGDASDIKLITNSKQFIDEYGEPDNTSGNYFHYTALAFLEKGNKLWCLRVHESAQYGGFMIATTTETKETFTDLSNDYDTIMDSGYSGSLADDSTALFAIIGVNPGVWNSRISVAIDKLKSDTKEWETGTIAEASVADLSIAAVDQYTFRIKVYWENDDGNDELVETWVVSRKQKIGGYGKQLYLETKINGYSKYIRVSDSAIADTSMPDGFATQLNLGTGDDGTAYTSMAKTVIAGAIGGTGWYAFENPENVDIRILLNGGETGTAVQNAMLAIAEARADCIAIFDVDFAEMESSVSDAITWRKATNNMNSSYAAMYGDWKRINDPYNDVLIYIPPSGLVGAQFAFNDYTAQPWTAPAGFNRGRLNVVGSQRIFTEGERDLLYEAQINPIQEFRGEGTVIWGQKTMQTKSSALSRVNVRRLLIIIEKTMAVSLRPFVFENNSEITRFRIEAMLVEYLDLLSSQGAFQTEAGDRGFKVVVDTSNNTPAVIDRNELHVDVFVKPARTAEFIQLQTIVTSSGASFDELIARGVNL